MDTSSSHRTVALLTAQLLTIRSTKPVLLVLHNVQLVSHLLFTASLAQMDTFFTLQTALVSPLVPLPLIFQVVLARPANILA